MKTILNILLVTQMVFLFDYFIMLESPKFELGRVERLNQPPSVNFTAGNIFFYSAKYYF
jgi:hypothetical protein